MTGVLKRHDGASWVPSVVAPDPSTEITAAVTAHNADTTAVHGITDTRSVEVGAMFPITTGVGRWTQFPLGSASQGTANSQNTGYWSPMLLTETISIDRFAIEATGGVASAQAQIGLYRAATDRTPGGGILVADFGLVDMTASGMKIVTVSPALTLTPDLYYGVLVVRGTGNTFRYSTTYMPVPISTADPPNLSSQMWMTTGTFAVGALPANAAAMSTGGYSVCPRFGIRRSA